MISSNSLRRVGQVCLAWAFLLVAFLGVSLMASCSPAEEDGGSSPAAEFGDVVISEQEVTDYTAAFRAQSGLSDDGSWEAYLVGRGYSTRDWRENAIRTLATRSLVRKRAAELGIVPRESDVEGSIIAAKQAYGVDLGDDQAWAEALRKAGTTPQEFRESCEYASVQQQLVSQEMADEISASSDDIQEYLESNWSDRVVRRFSVISFSSDDSGAAKKAFAELSELSGKKLRERFNELVNERTKSDSGPDDSGKAAGLVLYSGDLGWDVSYSTEAIMDPDVKINVMAGQLYPQVVTTGDASQIYLCTDRFAFEPGFSYESLPDPDLKEAVKGLSLGSSLATLVDSYLANLVDDANVQVYEMPEGLPYDVEDEVLSSRQ